MLDVETIVRRFLDIQLQVHPDVVRYIAEKGDPHLIDEILASVPAETVVVGPRHIPGLKPERDGTRFLPEPRCEVLAGKPGSSGGIGGVNDYLHYFRDRYNRLGALIRNRCTAMPIEALVKNSRFRQEACTIIGMVGEVRTTANGHRMTEIEDPTGAISVLFNKDRPVFADGERLIPDEVIGIRGSLSNDGRLFFADQVYQPDVPISHAPFTSSLPGTAVFISDIHVGSTTFLPEAWSQFTSWLDGSNVSYLLVAGDLVDGIGVYPNQERELTIPNIYAQYEALARYFDAIPSYIRVILSPGNHDAVRGAEPQPAIPDRFTASFPKNCMFVENPAMVSLQGVRVLMYHGKSIDDMISLIPGASYGDPGPLMDGMIQRRHLAPSYGKKTPLAAMTRDSLIIDPLPEVLHTGHIHICGVTRYRGILGINAGTWQSQTAFQKQMNVNPTPARAVILDLATMTPEIRLFN